MPIFSDPEDFKEHKQYVILLKKALLVVKPGVGKKFLYFKKYPFGAKKLPLVLVDFDLNCPAALAKAGFKPTAQGLVSLTAQEELNFEANKGDLKRIRIKKYFATMGGGIKAVFVPPGEVDDEDDTQTVSAADAAAPAAATAETAATPTPGTPAPDENEAKRRQFLARIEELERASFPSDKEALAKQALAKARALVGENKFAEATLLLDQLAARAASKPPPPQAAKAPSPPASPAAVKPAAAPAPAPADAAPRDIKLSTYLMGRANLRQARETAEKGLRQLQQAILAKADGEGFFKEVETKSQRLFDFLTPLDDSVVNKLDEAGKCGDPDLQIELNKQVCVLIQKQLAALRAHPLSSFVEKNPFGKFVIKQPVEVTLSALETQLRA